MDDSGKKWFAKREVMPKDVTFSNDNISWSSNGTSVSGAYPKYVYTLNEEAFKAKLTVEDAYPGWKIGRTYLTPDKKTLGEVFIFVPRGKISGTLTIDGKEVQVTGNAYADRFHGNQRFDRVDQLFYSVRALTPLPGSADINIHSTFNRSHPGYGKISTPGLLIMGPKAFVKATVFCEIVGQDFQTDPQVGYNFPRKLIVKSDLPGFTFRGVFTSQRNLEVLDILSQLPPYLRKIAEVFFKVPVFSKWDGIFEGSYTLNGTQTNFKLRSLGEVNLIGGKDVVPKQ